MHAARGLLETHSIQLNLIVVAKRSTPRPIEEILPEFFLRVFVTLREDSDL